MSEVSCLLLTVRGGDSGRSGASETRRGRRRGHRGRLMVESGRFLIEGGYGREQEFQGYNCATT
jgi:hypothetical protein